MPTINRKERPGIAKEFRGIFQETDCELLTNLMRGIHLDGGGKLDFYSRKSKMIMTSKDPATALWKHDHDRMTALRISMLKRWVLLKLRAERRKSWRLTGNLRRSITFEEYVAAFNEAVERTLRHPRKLKPVLGI